MGILQQIREGDVKALARAITIVENTLEGSEDLLHGLHAENTIPLIGITGPPGAGKSTLMNLILRDLTAEGKKIAVVAIDPTSPFNYGSLLGDRLRMNDHFINPSVFIRSVATRGSLGGLSDKILEITDLIREAPFDYVFVETVGVGQSEVEIAGLADTTVLVLVPESGDEVQTMKSGVMEIADIIVINKSEREGADRLFNHLTQMVTRNSSKEWTVPVIKTSATTGAGVDQVLRAISEHRRTGTSEEKKVFLLTEKAYRRIRQIRMKNVHKKELHEALTRVFQTPGFNLYRFADQYVR
ncbi:MAG: methylmalonyl Co-A mutase-associated GTPase MeaB [Bacteroidia bacterium]|nr:methylmalonyl Co-A mutase-associated GTPase MeaB [Bacteroidia bacterium]